VVQSSGGRTRFRWWLVAGLVSLISVAGLLILLVLGPQRWLDQGDKVASVGSMAVAAIGVAVSVVSLRMAAHAGQTADSATVVSRATEDLARQVATQWLAEKRIRGLSHRDPIRVTWSTTSRPVAPAPAEMVGRESLPDPVARVTRLRLRGDAADLARGLSRAPFRQLVVIGGAGSGKTTLALLLAVDLLNRRRTGDPVPVLLAISSWDPYRQHFDTWLAQRLAALYPMLSGRGPYGSVAVRLVGRGMILPVLDGLDELPEHSRARAISELTTTVGGDRPIVLTSRATEYQSAIDAAGAPLARAVVVEIGPIAAADAGAYLPAGQLDGQQRWAPVIQHLARRPQGPLARAFATPLMVYLASAAYSKPGSDPADLLALDHPSEIEEHLLRGYLPAVYTQRARPPDPDTAHSPRLRDYPPDKALRWLGYLADHLTRHNTSDLAWWQLYRAVPRPMFALAVAVQAALIGGIQAGVVAGLVAGPSAGLAFGLSVGLAFGLAFMLICRRAPRTECEPQQLYLHTRSLVLALAAGLAFGLTAGLTSGPRIGLTFGLVVGLTTGLTAGLVRPALRSAAVTPQSTLRNDRIVALAAQLTAGLAGLTFGLVAGLTIGFTVALAFVITVGRTSRTWSTFVVMRHLLALRQGLPQDLMRFLDDAHQRGILRQTGAVYQFRHARLQEHLTKAHRAWPTADPPTPKPTGRWARWSIGGMRAG